MRIPTLKSESELLVSRCIQPTPNFSITRGEDWRGMVYGVGIGIGDTTLITFFIKIEECLSIIECFLPLPFYQAFFTHIHSSN